MPRRGDPERIYQAQRSDDAWQWIEDQRHPPKVVKTDMDAQGDDGQVFCG